MHKYLYVGFHLSLLSRLSLCSKVGRSYQIYTDTISSAAYTKIEGIADINECMVKCHGAVECHDFSYSQTARECRMYKALIGGGVQLKNSGYNLGRQKEVHFEKYCSERNLSCQHGKCTMQDSQAKCICFEDYYGKECTQIWKHKTIKIQNLDSITTRASLHDSGDSPSGDIKHFILEGKSYLAVAQTNQKYAGKILRKSVDGTYKRWKDIAELNGIQSCRSLAVLKETARDSVLLLISCSMTGSMLFRIDSYGYKLLSSIKDSRIVGCSDITGTEMIKRADESIYAAFICAQTSGKYEQNSYIFRFNGETFGYQAQVAGYGAKAGKFEEIAGRLFLVLASARYTTIATSTPSQLYTMNENTKAWSLVQSITETGRGTEDVAFISYGGDVYVAFATKGEQYGETANEASIILYKFSKNLHKLYFKQRMKVYPTRKDQNFGIKLASFRAGKKQFVSFLTSYGEVTFCQMFNGRLGKASTINVSAHENVDWITKWEIINYENTIHIVFGFQYENFTLYQWI